MTMKEIKAIPTLYKGIEFRSRLEARWAVFFNACGVNWEYEPEGFTLPDGTWYLPDFLLRGVDGVHGGNLWVEVKGNLTDQDLRKVWLFAGYTDDEEDGAIKLNRPLTPDEVKRVRESGLVDQMFLNFEKGGVTVVTKHFTHPIIVLGPLPKGDNLQAIYFDACGLSRKRKNGEFNFYYINRYDNAHAFPIITENGNFKIDHPYELEKSEKVQISGILGNCDEDRTYEAYKKALWAKFEHGRKG